MVGFYFFQPHVANTSTMMPSQTVPTAIQPSATIIPTNSPAPTSTFVSTPSSAPQLHLLEIPVTGDERKFLVHLVGRGDTFETIAAAYNTTPEVIRALNYSMKLSLWANSAIVISPGLKIVDPTLPAFQTHKTLEGETDIDKLAQKLKVDPLLLRQYNDCAETCSLTVGDWLIVPVSK
jgi:LysM domain